MFFRPSKASLILAGDVNDHMTREILIFLDDNKNEAVDIWLNTEGGPVAQAIEISRLFVKHGHVSVIAYGECCSAGTLILCVAKERLCTPNCTFLIHYGEDSNSTKNEAIFNKKMFKWMINQYAENLKVKKNTITSWLNTERFMFADEALKFGLIDGIIK